MRSSNANITDQLHYDPETGKLTWKVSKSGVTVGMEAGSLNKNGYVHIRVMGKNYQAHRLIWLYVTGKLPTKHIDHINGIKNDNRWCNLREVSIYENNLNVGKQSNNTSGYKGVSFYKKHKKWAAICSVKGKQNFLGFFNTALDASKAYIDFAKKHHGEFFRI